jgi:hypothetical protein
MLLYTATVTPYRIAVFDDDTLEWLIIDLVVDCLFFLDVIINLFLAFYDANMSLVTNHRKILVNYATGWLFPDLIACLPL